MTGTCLRQARLDRLTRIMFKKSAPIAIGLRCIHLIRVPYLKIYTTSKSAYQYLCLLKYSLSHLIKKELLPYIIVVQMLACLFLMA
jgi:hypothetical protein